MTPHIYLWLLPVQFLSLPRSLRARQHYPDEMSFYEIIDNLSCLSIVTLLSYNFYREWRDRGDERALHPRPDDHTASRSRFRLRWSPIYTAIQDEEEAFEHIRVGFPNYTTSGHEPRPPLIDNSPDPGRIMKF